MNFKSLFKTLTILFLLVLLSACSKGISRNIGILPTQNKNTFLRGVDLSALPEIELTNPLFYNLNDQAEAILTTLKNNGVNVVRLKLWHTPANIHASFNEVKTFSNSLHNLGFKVWLTVHYSDTWADPGNQKIPAKWKNLSFNTLKDSVYNYTKKIVMQINPDYIQIGNEINNGFMWPAGNIFINKSQFKDLLAQGIKAVRDANKNTKIIIHYAGFKNAIVFYNKLLNLDYDIIGLSYYPIWHGKDLSQLKAALSSLNQTFKKPIVIAETAYPFTLKWNDKTNNIVGDSSQLILPKYPATPQGQSDFLAKIKEIISNTNQGIGFCYWGAELIAFKGKNATDGSPWENQALYNFANKALPAMRIFNKN